MKSGEDFRQAMGPADDGFIKVIDRVLSDLRAARKPRRFHRTRNLRKRR